MSGKKSEMEVFEDIFSSAEHGDLLRFLGHIAGILVMISLTQILDFHPYPFFVAS